MVGNIGNITILLAALLIIDVTTPGANPAEARAQVRDDPTSMAVARLWSGDYGERQSAKRVLAQMGAQAVHPLAALVEELLREHSPRFATGREADGRAALERYRACATEEEARSAFQETVALAINTRLLGDATEILGDTRSPDAVPILVSLMARAPQASHFYDNSHSAGRRALVAIGSAAIPKLEEVLRSIDSIPWEELWAIAWEDEGQIHVTGRRPSPETQAMLQANPKLVESEKVSDAEMEGLMRSAKRKIRRRIAMVLGDIGDPKALPILEGLRALGDGGLAPYLDDAVGRIEVRSRK